MRLDSQLSRVNCQMFSMGFNSGALGGNGSSVMLAGTLSLVVVCHPARSRMRTAWAFGATCDDISSRCHCMAWVLQRGSTRPDPTPDRPHRRDKPTSCVGPSVPRVGCRA